jgi:ABC-type protease/lipase transport system fused ATPase/permease subunit
LASRVHNCLWALSFLYLVLWHTYYSMELYPRVLPSTSYDPYERLALVWTKVLNI